MSLNLPRGLLATILCGLLGPLAAMSLALGFIVCKWLVAGAAENDLQYDLKYLPETMIYPLVGCAAVFACAGWATFAPAVAGRFTKSLAIIFSVSVSLWFIIGVLELTPRRVRSVEHPVFYLAGGGAQGERRPAHAVEVHPRRGHRGGGARVAATRAPVAPEVAEVDGLILVGMPAPAAVLRVGRVLQAREGLGVVGDAEVGHILTVAAEVGHQRVVGVRARPEPSGSSGTSSAQASARASSSP